MALRAIVTRPAAQAADWVRDLGAALETRGERELEVVALPLIAIHPLADPTPLHRAWAELAEQSLVFFVSANAVTHFFAARPPGLAWPAGTLAAAPGPGTAAVLREAGVPAAQIVAPAPDAPTFDSEQLWSLLRRRDWAGRDVLIVRGEDGRDWLAEQLRDAGAQPRYLAAYARGAPVLGATERTLLDAAAADPAAHLWLFSSSEAVRHLVQGWPVPAGARALATHPRIAEAAQSTGFAQVMLTAATVAGVADALVQARHAPQGGVGQTRSLQSGSL
ncbi:MAG: uroporphyrinogen-III synthase [Rhodoferax sp.]|nr:uroporphyrinogen-III synthase [Rhodoferax sp.]